MTREEYLKSLNVKSSSELTDEQVLRFFLDKNDGYTNAMSAASLISDYPNIRPDYKKGVKLLKRVFDKGGRLNIIYIESEGVLDKMNYIPEPHYEMYAD